MGNKSSKDNDGSLEHPIQFTELEDKICTGDLAILKRPGGDMKHYAVFIQHDKSDENFPLLLIKGRTKPMASFDPNSGRQATPVTAVTKIFYGNYETAAICSLQTKIELSCHEVLKMVDEIADIAFSEVEVTAVQSAKSDMERSSILSAFMIAHLYKKLGVLKVDPFNITPQNLEENLPLADPMHIKLHKVNKGSVAKGDPPFLYKLVEGIKPPPDVDTAKLNDILPELKTGDIILTSGATTGGALIKLFDGSQFTHVGIVVRMKYSSSVFMWESEPNPANLVDAVSGEVKSGVELIPLRHKILSGWEDRVAIRKLTGIDDEKREQMYTDLMKFMREVQGRPYEKNLLDLVRSAFDFKEDYLTFMRNSTEDLSSIFCSELVAEAYKRMKLYGDKKLSSEYTPNDFTSKCDKENPLLMGKLEKEVFIELKLD